MMDDDDGHEWDVCTEYLLDFRRGDRGFADIVIHSCRYLPGGGNVEN